MPTHSRLPKAVGSVPKLRTRLPGHCLAVDPFLPMLPAQIGSRLFALPYNCCCPFLWHAILNFCWATFWCLEYCFKHYNLYHR